MGDCELGAVQNRIPQRYWNRFLYLEFSERAIERILQQRQENRENDEINLYGYDDEDQEIFTHDPHPKRKRST